MQDVVEIVIKDQVMARAPEPSLVLTWRDGVPLRLSDLIRERVLLEMERAAEAPSAARPLVTVADPTAREQAVAAALEGFRRNAFFVTVDDRQVTDLDAGILLRPETEITFIRLVPLRSG